MKKNWINIIIILFVCVIIVPIFLNMLGVNMKEGLEEMNPVRSGPNTNGYIINANIGKAYKDLNGNMFSDDDATKYFKDGSGNNMIYEILQKVNNIK